MIDRKEIQILVDLIFLKLDPLNSFMEASIIFLNKTKMAENNLKYLNHEGATDVISFRYDVSKKPKQYVAELLVCPEVAWEASKKYNRTPSEELYIYIIHGFLHCFGYNDTVLNEKRVMFRKQNLILKSFLNQTDK